jgi:hypothetical protein
MLRTKLIIAVLVAIPIILLGFQNIFRSSSLGIRKEVDIFDNLDFDEQQIWRNVMSAECLVTGDPNLINNTR